MYNYHNTTGLLDEHQRTKNKKKEEKKKITMTSISKLDDNFKERKFECPISFTRGQTGSPPCNIFC